MGVNDSHGALFRKVLSLVFSVKLINNLVIEEKACAHKVKKALKAFFLDESLCFAFVIHELRILMLCYFSYVTE